MKRIYLLISFSLACMLSNAQTPASDSWKVKWNTKLILQASKEDQETNVKKISAADLDKKCFFEIAYKESDKAKEKEWKRSFLFMDENDQELLRKDSTHSIKMPAADLKKLFGDKKKIKIYTIAIPTDPDMAARVRVRRVHLCTLELQ